MKLSWRLIIFGPPVLRSTLGALLCALPAGAGREGQVAPEPPSGAVVLDAQNQEQLEDGHLRARGYVVIQYGDARLQADVVDFWNHEMRAIAEGNVVFQQGDQKIVGTRMEVNLRDGTGKFYNAHGVAGQDLYFYGDVVERESEDVYVVEGGAFTSCAQPVPRWRFTAGKARIRRDRYVYLRNAFLKVKSIPVFYAPLIYYPIDEQGRATGFLLPRIGKSSFKGFLVSEAFFWAINRSMDATFTVDSFSRAGVGTGTEYRYVLSPESQGQFLTYFLRDKVSGQREYNLNYSMNQGLGGGFRSVARVDYFSSFDYQQRYQESYNAATQRSKRASGNITRSWSRYNFRITFDRNDTSFEDSVAVRQILPQITFSSRPTKLAATPLLFSFSTEASRLSRTQRQARVEYQRFDVLPSISYPFTMVPYLTFRTTLSGRYTYYTSQLEGVDIFDEPVDRRYYEVQFDMRGPTFARIFNTPGNFYAERYKHVIEPQVVWSYRSRVDDFASIPKFDSQDYVPGTNQVAFSLVNRFLAKRGPQGQKLSAPVEFLTWVVSQRYFFDINASLYDPQYSTPYFTSTGTPSHYSPVTSKVVFRPNRDLFASWNLEYDVNYGQLRSVSVAATMAGPGWGSARGMWSRRNLVETGRVRNNVSGRTDLKLGSRIDTDLEVNYDLTFRNMTQLRAGVTYNVQCCGFLVEYSRYSFGGFRDENLFRFGITLANVGSFGSFLGGQAVVQ